MWLQYRQGILDGGGQMVFEATHDTTAGIDIKS